MSEPRSEQVDKVLGKLDQKSNWQSDADRLHLPLATVTSGSGAKVLDVDGVLRRTTPTYEKGSHR
jgi:hypothetical protein